jgi:hypothetical protein
VVVVNAEPPPGVPPGDVVVEEVTVGVEVDRGALTPVRTPLVGIRVMPLVGVGVTLLVGVGVTLLVGVGVALLVGVGVALLVGVAVTGAAVIVVVMRAEHARRVPPALPVPLHWVTVIGTAAGLIREAASTVQAAVEPPPVADPLHWVTVALVVVAG